MATEKLNADLVRPYMTGTLSDSDVYTSLGSLGGQELSSRYVSTYRPLVDLGGSPNSSAVEPDSLAIPNIRIERIIGNSSNEGRAVISATDTSKLAYTAPGDTQGTEVTIANGATVLLESASADYGVVVTRTSATDLAGETRFDIKKQYDNVFACGNVTNTERAAGKTNYRAVGLNFDAATSNPVAFKAYLGTFGTQQTTDSAQLGAAGAGTITTTGSFSDWKATGYARIETSGGSLREVVYYSSRTATSLTVPAAGRGLLGTSAAAGASDDVIDGVPGVALGTDTYSGGTTQHPANETTAPTSAPSNVAITAGGGVSFSVDPASTTAYVLRIRRDIAAGAVAEVEAEVKIIVEFSEGGGTTYTQEWGGFYRVSDTTNDNFELYIGEDAQPDFTASPDTTNATLPFNYVLTPPGAGTTVFNFTVRKRNGYDLLSQNTYTRSVELNTSGADITGAISDPTNLTLTNLPGGEIRITADYSQSRDSSPADTWNITYSVDADVGTLTTGQAPNETETMATFGYGGGAEAHLDREIGPFLYNTTVTVLVAAERSSDNERSVTGIQNTSVIDTYDPVAIDYRDEFIGDYRSVKLQQLDAPTTTLSDPAGDISIQFADDKTSVYFGATLAWAVVYNGDDSTNGQLYIPSTISLAQTTSASAAIGWNTPFHALASPSIGGNDEINLWISQVDTSDPGKNVHRFDLTDGKFYFRELDQTFLTQANVPYFTDPGENIHRGARYLHWDRATQRFIVYMEVDTDQVYVYLPLNQTKTQAQIEAL